jgi:uncharacterized protein
MKIRRMSFRMLVLALLIAGHAGAAEFVVPALRSAVTDQAGILSASTRQQLESALRQLQSVGGTQLAVLTVPDLAGLTIEQASIRVVDAWKLGGEKADNGVLLLVARDERKVRIEVGQGLEGALTDAYSKRIIDEAITPLFKQGDMDGGVIVGVFQIARITNPGVDLRPYLEGSLRQGRAGRARSPWQSIFGILLMAAVFSTRRGFLPLMFLGGMGMGMGMGGLGSHRRGGGFGAGGGGFGGFGGGGGGFSGGGASGGW